MSTYLMFGKYSTMGLKEANSDRTNKAVDLIKKYDGEVKSMYALLGEQDLLLIVNFPNIEHAMKASVALNKITNISFTTSMAVTVEEFDNMMNEV